MTNLRHAITLALFLLFSQLGRSQNDCVDAVVVCGDTGFKGLTATGIGNQELVDSNTCYSQENNSIWLKLPIQTSGTLAFVLTPESTDIQEDFDFFIFGPNVACDSLGIAIRCSTTNPWYAAQPDNLTGMNNVETDTSEGPGELGNSFVQQLTVNAGEVYFLVIDRPVGESNFSITWNGNATFESQPTVTTSPHDLQKCMPTGNFAVFDLDENYGPLMGAQSGVNLSFHTNSNDAITGENAILSPAVFPNTSNPQTIYARLTNLVSNCFTTADFELSVTNGATVSVDTYTICDDASDGNGANAQSIIDLDDVTQHIMAGQNTTGMTISYFGTASAAALNTLPALPIHFYNTTPNLQKVYVRISDSFGCITTNEINLNVIPQPPIVATTLTQCDLDFAPDGITTFDLARAIPALTGGNANLSVVFFASGNSTPLNLLYTNQSNPQQLNVEITNTITGCKNTSTLTLVVNSSPPPAITIAPQCDILGIENGIGTFDLNAADFTLTPTQSVHFYSSPNDALLAQNEITTAAAYPNAVPYNDTVYVRIDDSGNCASISTLMLSVNKLPVVERSATGLVVCDDDPDYQLTIDAAILEGVPSDYTYNWFQDGIAMGESGYSIEVNQGAAYTVDVTRLGCTVTRTVTVSSSEHANIESIVVNDLVTDYNTVTVNVQGLGDYVFSIDNPTGPFQQSNFFTDVAPGIHDLYVKDLLACGTWGPIQVNVLGAPKYFTPNNDGFNDTWNIRGVDGANNGKATIYIFDRYGKLMKQISPLGMGWDGNYLDKPAPAEDYWYAVYLEDARKAKGHFTLKR